MLNTPQIECNFIDKIIYLLKQKYKTDVDISNFMEDIRGSIKIIMKFYLKFHQPYIIKTMNRY
jgi:hypothetical protein